MKPSRLWQIWCWKLINLDALSMSIACPLLVKKSERQVKNLHRTTCLSRVWATRHTVYKAGNTQENEETCAWSWQLLALFLTQAIRKLEWHLIRCSCSNQVVWRYSITFPHLHTMEKFTNGLFSRRKLIVWSNIAVIFYTKQNNRHYIPEQTNRFIPSTNDQNINQQR